MFNINSYLEKFKNVGVAQVLLRETVTNCINEKVKIQLQPQEITIKNGIITIKASPAVKGEIFMKKKALLDAISRQSPQSSIRDISFF